MSAPGHRPVLAALILAAGYSSRMGRFKPLLPLGDQTAVERVIETFRGAGIVRIVVVTGHEAARLEPVLHALRIDTVRNPNHDRGMYSSVQAGLGALAADVDACFLLPADIPLVRPATVEAIAARYRSGGAHVVYPRFRARRGHPPLIARALFDAILAGASDGGLRAVLQDHAHAAADVDVIDEGVLLDMDRPDDYARLADLASRRHLPTAAECEALLEARAVADPIRRHSRAVAAVAQALAMRLARVDRNLVLAGSLLHDIAKGQPGHAEVGAALVSAYGFPAVADVVRQHMDLDFDTGAPNEAAIDEAAIVFMADKLVRMDHRIALEERFRPAFERFRDQPDALQGARRKYATARAVLGAIERQAGAALPDLLADCEVTP